ncbi:MAG: 3-keto-disaccharide hydrolase [Thermoguttaceae bacterium]
MTVPRMLLAAALVFPLFSPAALAGQAANEGEWRPLFNGKNLDGWVPKITGYELGDNFGNTFRVENGVLKVAYDGYDKFDGKFGHLFYEKPYSRYILRVEYRFLGEQVAGGPGWAFRNSGIMIHGQSPESMARDQQFPVSIEVQLLGGSGRGERTTANVCTPGTNFVQKEKLVTTHCNNSSSRTFHGDQWVTVEVEVHGSKLICHRVNGEQVFEYEQPQFDPNDGDARKLIKDGNLLIEGGSISLQSESHPCEFRKVEIRVLQE